MAIARDGTGARVAFTAGTTVNLSYTGTTGAFLFASVVVNATTDKLTSCKYNNVAMNLVASGETAGIGQWTYLFCLGGQLDGTAHNVTVVISDTTLVTISAISYTGADTTTPTGTQAAFTSAAAASTWAQSLTPTTTGSWAIATVTEPIGRAITAGANTAVVTDGAGQGDHLVDSNASTLTGGNSFALNISNFSGTSPATQSVMAIIAPVAATPPNLVDVENPFIAQLVIH